ncbi:RES domain-containing protein [Trebonia kvetii]|uniref:RES domain-containing protein n=1 Tax=Trebonia kvetii TaxID=2480626 RepID=A0A6P2C135_9ACTN|nr:HEPN-associated N-terminal domain-containing protein [Trebonia kvetii]TVZ05074.1 RES domain-containing protein [Trebonia kvetii]
MSRTKDYYEELAARGFGDTGEQSVCLECITDEGLRSQVADQLTENACSFCDREAQAGEDPIAASFELLMLSVMEAIHFFYVRSNDSLYWDDDVTRRYTSQEVAEDVCSGAVSDSVLQEIFDCIEHNHWNKDPGAVNPGDAFRYAWDDFRQTVKHKTRFVFLSIPEESSRHPDEYGAAEILEKLVDIIQTQDILTEVPAGRVFYRGRMIDEPDGSYDASSLGSPPDDAASVNRMSPAGISMFYGADDIATVIAEIGAHTSKRFAVVGAFETVRPLHMVDLANLPPAPSYFDPDGRKHYYELLFMYGFAEDLSAPVTADGREHIEYVPTQVLTEYLRWLPDFSIDGILFTSSQNDGTACVVFCGPEGCANAGKETTNTVLRLQPDSIKAVRVVAGPAPM